MDRKKYVIWIDGQQVPVSQEIYRIYQESERKERYFMQDLKAERIKIDIETCSVTFFSSREDSFERLLELNEQFAASDKSLEDVAVRIHLLEKLHEALRTLSAEEQKLIYDLYYLEKTVREVSNQYQVARSTLQSRKEVILQKLWNLLERFF